MDIGTGNGAFLSQLAKAHPNISFIGIDNQQQMVDRASNVLTKNARYLVGDVHGKASNIGSKLVGILKDAGFRSIKQEIEPLNTETTDMTLLQKFIMQEVA